MSTKSQLLAEELVSTPVHTYRRENLRKLIADNGGPSAIGRRLGYANSAWLVQMTGPNPTRNVSEATAREYEIKLGLPMGVLDTPLDIGENTVPPPRRAHPLRDVAFQPTGSLMSPAQVDELIAVVGKVCEDEHVSLPISKFADIVRLSISDMIEHGNRVREDHVKMLIKLTK